jgi:hypothetical protein
VQIFILEHHTPRTFKLLAARSVKPTDKGFSFVQARQSDNLQADQVMSVLINMARRLPAGRVELAKCYEAAQNDSCFSGLLKGTKYVSKQGNRPAMVIVND